MDWGITANIATVVVPAVSALGWVLEMRIQLLIERNNALLIRQINGTYLKKESADDKIRATVAEAQIEHDARVKKLETDMRNVTSSLARRSFSQ